MMAKLRTHSPAGERQFSHRPASSFGNFAKATKAAALPLMIPIILLGGIMTGWFAPREAGVVAIVYILLVVIPLLNFGHLRHLPRDFAQAGLIYSLPLITIGAASAFGWMLAYLRGPIVVSGWIADVAGNNPYKIMFALVALFTIVGDFIQPIPCIVIFMPIVAALTDIGGINPVHMGVVLIVTLAFGLITPPYGLALLMASKFIGVRFSQALRASLSIYVVFFCDDRYLHFFARRRAVASQAPLPGVGRLLQEPKRRRLYLPVSVLATAARPSPASLLRPRAHSANAPTRSHRGRLRRPVQSA